MPTACASKSACAPWDDVMERWDELVSQHRHFGFFWLPDRGVGRALRPRRRTASA